MMSFNYLYKISPWHSLRVAFLSFSLTRPLSAVVAAFAVILSSCATSFPNQNGVEAPFLRNGLCAALSQWVEPLKWRYPKSSPSRWDEQKSRNRMKFLFIDDYFVPVFGTPIDELSDKQVAAIYKGLKATRKSCKSETYLQSIFPYIFIARVFDPRFPNTPFSKSFVINHANTVRKQQSAMHSAKKDINKATIRLVQQRIAEEGFNIGTIDGIKGQGTIDSIIAYKKSKNMVPANGELSGDLLARLDAVNVATPKSKPKTSVVTKPKRQTTPSANASSPNRVTPKYNVSASSRTNESASNENPEDLKVSTEKVMAGTAINITVNNKPYFAGIAGAVLETCPSVGSIADRTKLAKMIFSVSVSDPLANLYSNDNLGQTLSSGAKSSALINVGDKLGREIGCGQKAESVISALSKSLESSASKRNETNSTFITSCQNSFDIGRCQCLARVGESVMPNIHNQSYDRSIVPTIISRNPLIGIQIGIVCGISNY